MRVSFPKSLNLASLPTSLERLKRTQIIPFKNEIYLKRDDLTGFGLSGNKIRKLEFLAGDALDKKSDTLITCGGFQSNHARATALLASQLGLKTVLVLFGEGEPQTEGNLFLIKLCNAEIRFIPLDEYEKVDKIMKDVASELKSKGKKPYVIPEGGSNPLGVWGYIKAAFEIKRQTDEMKLKIDKVVTALSSAGTYCGLFLGAKLCGWETEILGINVRYLPSYPEKKIFSLLEETISAYGLKVEFEKEEIQIIEGYTGEGYALSRPEELEFIRAFVQQTGLLIDQVYTGKTMYGLAEMLKKGEIPEKENILFLHTGGGFGLFPAKDRFF